MSRLRYNRKAAIEHLKTRCPRMAEVIRQKGPFRLRVERDMDLFRSLAASIAYQQLSGKAAATIHGRFEALFPGGVPDAALAADMSHATLRSVGLSNNKALAIHDLAAHVVAGKLPGKRRLAGMDDAEIVDSLCRVRGIGPWTVQMKLIFSLGRPDVMPATDLGIQKGVQVTYSEPELPTPARVLELTSHLAPYRSPASWYFWRIADD